MKKIHKILALLLAICTLAAALPVAAEEALPVAGESCPIAAESPDREFPVEAAAESGGEASGETEALTEAAAENVPVPSTDPAAEVVPETEAAAEVTPEPSTEPLIESSDEPTIEPPVEITPEPTIESPVEITPEPTIEPSVEITPEPAIEPVGEPSMEPSVEPSAEVPDEALFPTEIFIEMGQTYQLPIAQHPDYAGKLRYSQNDYSRRFHISEGGLITGLDQGEEHLFVQMGDSLLFFCKIIVTYVELPAVPVEQIIPIQNSFTMTTANGFEDIKPPQLLPAGAAGELSYSIADPEIAELEEGYPRIYGLRGGETELIITAESGVSIRLPITVIPSDYNFEIDENGVLTRFTGWHRLVEIPEGVTAIGVNAFKDNNQVRTVILPESCTRIETRAFRSCGLRRIELPDGLKEIGDYAFEYASLREIELPEGMESIGTGAFYGCELLSSINLPEGMEVGAGALSGTAIRKLKIPGSPAVIAENFLPQAIEELEISEGVTEISAQFISWRIQEKLRSVTLPASLTKVGENFMENGENRYLATVYAPAGSFAEQFCAENRIHFVPDETIYEDDLFRIEGDVLTRYKGAGGHVAIPERVKVIGKEVFFRNSGITGVALHDGITEIGEFAFADCVNLQSIDLPDGIKALGDYAFRGCTAIKTVDLPDSLTDLGFHCFDGCTSLETLRVGSGVRSLRGFYDCTSLREVSLSEGLNGISDHAFGNCVSLEGIDLPESLTYLGYACFSGCTRLKEIHIPDAVTYISGRAFAECSALESIRVPAGAETIEWEAFMNCSALKEIRLSDNLWSVYSNLFSGCTSLTSVYLPETVREIGDEAFMDCRALKSVYIPAKTKDFGKNIFLNCPDLTVLTPSGSAAEKYCRNNGVLCAKPSAIAGAVAFPEGDLTLGVGQCYELKCTADSDFALGTISFSSSSSKVVSVDKLTGEITARRTGSATITARADSGAKASCKITVKKAPDSVEFAEEEILLIPGESMQLGCILPKNTAAGLRFEGSNFFTLHVEPDGRITAVGTGTDTVTVTTHNGKSDTCTVTVLEAPNRVILPESEIRIPQTLSHQLEPAVNAGSICRSYSYASSDPAIASVDAGGRISAHAMGTAQITVSVAATPEVFALCTVTVTDPPPRILLDAGEITLGVKESFDLNPRYDGDFEGSFSCESSNVKVAAITQDGVVTAKKTGSAVITVTAENGLTTSCSVTVKKAPSSVKLNPAKLELGAGESMQLAWTLSSGSAGSVGFESSDPAVADVRADGLVTAVAPGSATVQVRTFNGRKASAKITVYPAPESIRIERNGDPLILGVGESGLLGVKFSEGSRGAYSFASSDSDIVEIDAAGNFRAKMLGECSLTLTAYNGVQEIRKLRVIMPDKLHFHISSYTIGVGQQCQLLFTGTGVSFKSSSTRTASVDVNGLVTGLRAGTVTITGTSQDGSRQSCKLTVKKAPTKLRFETEEIMLGMGEFFEPAIKTTPSGSWVDVQYSCSDPEAIRVYEDGSIQCLRSSGSYTLTATNYNGVEATMTIHGAPAPANLSLPWEEVTLWPGAKLPLVFEGDGCYNTLFVQNTDPSVAEFNEDGVLVAKKKGSTTITFETYNYVATAVEVTVGDKPKNLRLKLPVSLRTGMAYNLCDYFSCTPDIDPMVMIQSVKVSGGSGEILHDDTGWYLHPLKPGSISLTVKTLAGSLKAKASVMDGVDPGLPDIHSPVDTTSTAADYIGTWKLACLGSQEHDLLFTPAQMGVSPYIINIRENDADIISDDNSLYGFPVFMDGSTLILDTIGNKIPALMHQNGCLTLPQETQGVYLWFVKQ